MLDHEAELGYLRETARNQQRELVELRASYERMSEAYRRLNQAYEVHKKEALAAYRAFASVPNNFAFPPFRGSTVVRHVIDERSRVEVAVVAGDTALTVACMLAKAIEDHERYERIMRGESAPNRSKE